MLFDRYHQIAALCVLIGALALFSPAASNAFLLAGVVGLVLLAVVLSVTFAVWYTLARLLAPPRMRAMLALRAAKREPNDALIAKAAGKVIAAFKLGASPANVPKEALQDLMRLSALIDTWLPPVAERPLTAFSLARALAAAWGGLSDADTKALMRRLEDATSPESEQGLWRRLRRGRNRWLSRLVAPDSEIQALEEDRRHGLFEATRPDPNPQRVAIFLLCDQAVAAEGLPQVSDVGSLLRALPPRKLRMLVLIRRLMRDENAIRRMRLTDPSLYPILRAGMAELPKAPPPKIYPPPHPAPPPTTDPDQMRAEVVAMARDALLLRRVWPIDGQADARASGQSWLGGTPALPPTQPWPRHPTTGRPLHFLAQIDCAALPYLETDKPLPPDGVLFFFGDIESEMDFETPGTAQVLYIPETARSGAMAQIPDDLPPLDHCDGRLPYSVHGPMRHLYPRWPVSVHALRSYPAERDGPNWQRGRIGRELWQSELAAFLAPATEREHLRLLTSAPLRGPDGTSLRDEKGERREIWSWADGMASDPAFPFCGGAILRFAIDLIGTAEHEVALAESEVARYGGIPADDTPPNPEQAKRLAKLADRRDRAQQMWRFAETFHGLGDLDTPTPAQVDAFRAFALAHPTLAEPSLRRALLALAREALTDADLFARLPASLFAAVDSTLRPTQRAEHVMLGYPQAGTNSTGTDADGVRLLVLDTDWGTDFEFCDCGVIEFYIPPDALARRDFSQAFARAAGG